MVPYLQCLWAQFIEGLGGSHALRSGHGAKSNSYYLTLLHGVLIRIALLHMHSITSKAADYVNSGRMPMDDLASHYSACVTQVQSCVDVLEQLHLDWCEPKLGSFLICARQKCPLTHVHRIYMLALVCCACVCMRSVVRVLQSIMIYKFCSIPTLAAFWSDFCLRWCPELQDAYLLLSWSVGKFGYIKPNAPMDKSKILTFCNSNSSFVNIFNEPENEPQEQQLRGRGCDLNDKGGPRFSTTEHKTATATHLHTYTNTQEINPLFFSFLVSCSLGARTRE